MAEQNSGPLPTLALSTKVEEEFISPLTAIRGALEIIRDFPDLDEDERRRFAEAALSECARLNAGIEHLAETVYEAARGDKAEPPAPEEADARFAGRLSFSADGDIADLDFSDFTFDSAAIVNALYDVIDEAVRIRGKSWYFLVNHHNCRVWPEAWVAFAHRSKKIATNFSLGTFRYAEGDSEARASDPTLLGSRAEALEAVERAKTEKAPRW